MSELIMDEEMRVEVILHDLLHKTLGASLATVAARQRAAILSSDWLSEHDRQVAERAWDEGARWAAVECGAIDDERQAWIAPGENPYTKGGQK